MGRDIHNCVTEESGIIHPSCVQWGSWGGDIHNTRRAFGEHKLSRRSASTLTQKWKIPTGAYGDVTSVPAVHNGVVYFGDFQGYVWAVNQATGAVIWKASLPALTGIVLERFNFGGTELPVVLMTRTTPAIAAAYGLLLIDTSANFAIGPAAYVLALNINTGALVWQTQADSHVAAILTMGGTVYGSSYYVGVSSIEELMSSAIPDYPCCSFQGSALALDIPTGNILWKTSMLPSNGGQPGGYAGSALWGSSPSIDTVRNTVFFASGNLYDIPPNVAECQEANGSQFPDPCIEPGNYAEAVVALDLHSGAVKWAKSLNYIDAWNLACGLPYQPTGDGNPNCPPQPGPDADFGMAPVFIEKVKVAPGIKKDLVIVGQKSGIMWALSAANGEIVWQKQAGPGGTFGGVSWGMATDGKRVYAFVGNSQHSNFTLQPGLAVTTGGGFIALDVTNGAVGDGVVVVLNSATGALLKTLPTGYSIYGGTSVDKGCIYVGNGYQRGKALVGSNSGPDVGVFSFCVADNAAEVNEDED
eukprot:jgi/Mesen1/1222/ME000129S00320